MKHLRYLLMAALVAMPLTACDEDDDTPTQTTIVGTVTGTVAAEGTGLSGVSVSLNGATQQSVTTGSGGSFTFSNVPAGSYGVSIDASTHSDVSFSQTSKTTSITTNGETATVDFAGSYIRTASIQGVVVAGNQGVVGVTATLTGGPDNVTKTGQTNAGGEFTFTGLRAGNYTVAISNLPANVSFASVSNSVTVSSVGESVTTAFAGNLLTPAKIMGQVLADGAPLGQVTVTLSMGSTTVATATTNANGEFAFTGLEPGSYTVAISGYDMNRYDFGTNTSANLTVDYGDEAVHNFGGAGNTASISVERITLPNGNAANRNAIAGMVVVQVGVDEGGEDITNVTMTLNGIQFGEQDFNRSAAGAQLQDEDDFEIDFPVNTAQTMSGPPFTPTWFNGVNTIVATATTADGDVVTATEDITLVNVDLLALDIQAANPGNGDVDTLIDGTTGLRWLSGSLTFNLYPIIYSDPFDLNDPPIARANMMFESFCSAEAADARGDMRPVVGANATQQVYTMAYSPAAGPQADGSFTWTLSDAVSCNTGVGVDDLITGWMGAQDFTINTTTKHGQPGPGAFCPNITSTCVGTGGTVAANPLLFYFNDELQSGTGAINNFLRVDNQEPWAGTIDLDQHTLAAGFNFSTAASALAGTYPTLIVNGVDAVRGGGNLNGLRDGWVNHAYAFDTGMWGRSAGTGIWGNRAPTDSPNNYPANTIFSAGYPVAGTEPIGANTVALGNPLMGIGLAPATTTGRFGYYAMATDASNATGARTITGIGAKRQRLVSASATAAVSTGADLPGENCLGCATLPAPNTNEWDDISLTAIAIDNFFNAGYTNVLEIGVDGKEPVFIGGASNITDPTTSAATKYNTYGATDSRGNAKTAGVWTSSNTDAGNGFSGVAGVWLKDSENGLSGSTLQGTGATINTRNAVQLQLPAGNPATVTLLWNWSLAASTFLTSTNAAIAAYDAALGVAATNDGYRVQSLVAYDRADNVTTPVTVAEHIADKTMPGVGNVLMPTVPLFTLGTSYTWGGEATDNVDLDFSDFGFDFNGIVSMQPWTDPLAGAVNIPQPDVDGNAYVNGGVGANSLQLPLRNVEHTAWGSASIYLHDTLSEDVEFLGCVVQFDEAGVGAAIQRPRGPRWRTWDQAFDNKVAYTTNYQLVNWQFNTFVYSSVPACPSAIGTMTARVTPAFGSAWLFGTSAFTSTAASPVAASGKLELAVQGPSGTFVPTIDPSRIDLYYIDVSGRARLLDPVGNWSGPVVYDTGAGPLARSYVWTWTGTAPSDIATGAMLASATGTSNGYFFLYRFASPNAGEAMLWNNNCNVACN